MNYKLYTLVDITHTGQTRTDPGKEALRWKEQNFQTVLQTLGIRANVTFVQSPVIIETKGNLVGFNTEEKIRVWRFDFTTDRDMLYENNGDPVAYLVEDFHLVPYIDGLDELMDQKYAVFNTQDPGKNITFFAK
jgi:hypothetical protein